MFFLLRRIIILGFYGVLAACGLYVYQQREVFRPIVDLFTLWRNSEPKKTASMGEVSGEVTRVIDGGTFQLKDAQGTNYFVRLTGLDIPRLEDPRSANDRAIARASKTNLMGLILRRQVKIDFTYTNQVQTGLGVVFLQETNINAKVLGAGMARLNSQFIKSLPLKQQYELFSAQREAQEHRVGLWK